MNLDMKKKQLNLKKVETAIMELEVRRQERLEDVERIDAHIKLQKEKEEEILNELKDMEE